MSVILQLSNTGCVRFQGMSFGLSVGLVFLLGGLRMRLPCIPFQQILNQRQMKFSVVYYATSGWQNSCSVYEVWLWRSWNDFFCKMLVYLQLTERDHLQSTPLEKLCT